MEKMKKMKWINRISMAGLVSSVLFLQGCGALDALNRMNPFSREENGLDVPSIEAEVPTEVPEAQVPATPQPAVQSQHEETPALLTRDEAQKLLAGYLNIDSHYLWFEEENREGFKFSEHTGESLRWLADYFVTFTGDITEIRYEPAPSTPTYPTAPTVADANTFYNYFQDLSPILSNVWISEDYGNDGKFVHFLFEQQINVATDYNYFTRIADFVSNLDNSALLYGIDAVGIIFLFESNGHYQMTRIVLETDDLDYLLYEEGVMGGTYITNLDDVAVYFAITDRPDGFYDSDRY